MALAPYTHDLLIDQETGQIDRHNLKQYSMQRARREFGGQNPPPSYLRDALRWHRSMADSMVLRWRMARGLPDNRPSSPMSDMLARGLEQYGAD